MFGMLSKSRVKFTQKTVKAANKKFIATVTT